MVQKCLPIMGGMEHMEVFFFSFRLVCGLSENPQRGQNCVDRSCILIQYQQLIVVYLLEAKSSHYHFITFYQAPRCKQSSKLLGCFSLLPESLEKLIAELSEQGRSLSLPSCMTERSCCREQQHICFVSLLMQMRWEEKASFQTQRPLYFLL